MLTMKRRALVGIGTLAHMGGAERQALYLVEHLAKSPDFEVEVLTFTDATAVIKPLDDLGVPVHVLSYYERWSVKKRLMSLARIAWHIRWKIRPDALFPFGAPASKAMALVWPYIGAKFCWWNQQDEGRGIYGTKTERRILKIGSAMATTPSLESHRHRIDRYSASDCRQCLGKNV